MCALRPSGSPASLSAKSSSTSWNLARAIPPLPSAALSI
jgi:hypothetical protein